MKTFQGKQDIFGIAEISSTCSYTCSCKWDITDSVRQILKKTNSQTSKSATSIATTINGCNQ